MKITMKNKGQKAPQSAFQSAYRVVGGLTLIALPMVLSGCTGNGSGGGGMASSNTSTTVAMVDGEKITRAELQAFSEAMAGEQALQQMIDYDLMMKELKAKNLEVSDEEVKSVLAKQRATMSEEEGKRFDVLMQSGAPQVEALRRQAKQRLALNKLLTKDVKASEADVKKWFDATKDARYPMHFNIGVLLTTQKARADAMERQLSSKAKTFKDLVDEQKKLNDNFAKQSTEDSKQPMTMDSVPPSMQAAIKSLKPGEVSKVLTISSGQGGQPGAYAIIRLIDKSETSFESMRSQAETDYKIEQVAREEFKKSAPPNMKFEDAIKQIRQNLGQQAMQDAMQGGPMQPPPTDADAIAALTRASQTKMLTDLRQSGKVQISEAIYQQVGDMYKPAPAAISPIMPPGSAPTGSAPTGNAPASKAPAMVSPGTSSEKSAPKAP